MEENSKDNGMIATDILAPTQVIAGKYRLGRVIGEGGMGAVYEAEHSELGAMVAIKLLSEASVNNPNSLARFRREAKVMGQLKHENVVSVMDAGTDDSGIPFLVMELLEGESLSSTLRRERILSPELAAWIISEVLAGLGAAHAKNIVHRDLKPGNIFVAIQSDGSRRVKLLDFGISKLRDSSATLNVTVQGALVGTPNFMAPEQIRAMDELDGRIDVYAAGVMLYRMVVGKLPYVGTSSEELYKRILEGDPIKPCEVRPEITEDLQAVILRAMHPDKNERYQSAQEFQHELELAVPSENYGTGRPFSGVRPTARALDSQRHGSHSSTVEFTSPRRTKATQAGTPASLRSGRTTVEPPTRTWHWVALFVIGLASAVGGVLAYSITRDTDANKQSPLAGTVDPENAIRFGVVQHKDPEKTQSEMSGLVEYLTEKSGRPVVLKILENYEDASAKLQSGELHIAALSAITYVRAKKAMPGLKLLATPTGPTGPTYYSYILARRDSGIQVLADFAGKTMCFTSESSASGFLYPVAEFKKAGMDPYNDFHWRMTEDHEKSLMDLNKGGCDGAAVYDDAYLGAKKLGIDPSSIVQIARTEAIPWDAYCVGKNLDPELVTKLQSALLELKLETPLAEEVLNDSAIGFSGFIPGEDSFYDKTRRVDEYLTREVSKDEPPDEQAPDDQAPDGEAP